MALIASCVIMFVLYNWMQSELGMAGITGSSASGLSRLDRLFVVSSVWISGVASGVFALIFLRCVLGFCARTCRFVGLVVAVTHSSCGGSLAGGGCLQLDPEQLDAVAPPTCKMSPFEFKVQNSKAA